ncbi:MAG TPA: zinc-binding dehydrogenase [Candidatus Hydrogenedentes bacterium]|nr:zinc-binding dehydrogenase [Candidatus Hydrogenedentota bacterium]HPG65720.1 zinc-binding dehydrogenase [Candidatus Hydrogenedentota bacterium]
MKTLALRLYGKNDLRLEEFELPALREDEILADIVSNSICMSSYKAAIQGADHKRVPKDVAQRPIILGHEFCGRILEVGAAYGDRFPVGSKYSIQPALSYPGRELDAPGYSFQYIGGDATKIIIPREVLEMNCLLPYTGDGFFKASLSEPVSCIIGAFNTSYHFRQGEYVHKMGIVEGGMTAVLAGAGPMGLGAIDYAIHGPRRPKLLVITDVDQTRLDRARSIFTPEDAKAQGVNLEYVNTSSGNPIEDLRAFTDGKGYDDVFVFAPVAPLVEQASGLLGFNGCLNFFAGPSKPDFGARINFYDVHYSGHHIVGSSGGNTEDMVEALDLMSRGRLNPAVMITHVGGLDCAAETILNLPNIPGGKKLIYTNISMPLTALEDFGNRGTQDPVFEKLAEITARHTGLWSVEAEEYLLANAKPISAS